jgi:CSLREA domain-containing protein
MHVRRLSRAAAAALVSSALGVALLLWLAVAPAQQVQAATYTVNVGTDGADLGADGVCDSDAAAGNQCSLRAAIQEANASVDQDVIAIGGAGPIVLGGPLPIITDNGLVITGSNQQVSMTAPNIAFEVNADGVHFNDLIIDGQNVGTVGIMVDAGVDDLVVDGVTVRGFTAGGYDNHGGGGQRATIRNSTFTDNPGDGIFAIGGKDGVIMNNIITNNGDAIADNGLEVANEDGMVIQGNTFSGNFDAQILVGAMGAGEHMTIIQNTITAGSDGLVIGGGVVATAHVDVGLSVDNRNVFRGTIAAPGEQYMRNLSVADINAIYNDWNAYTNAAIEGVICHGTDAGCGPGVIIFDPFITTPSPLPTITPTPTVTETPGAPTETPTETPVGGAPGDVETLPLIAGCNPLAWTGTDSTPIATIAGAVSPADILVALWEFDSTGVWLGYSPQFPEVSDLQQMNRLDVVFVCVSTTGTFSRPVI